MRRRGKDTCGRHETFEPPDRVKASFGVTSVHDMDQRVFKLQGRIKPCAKRVVIIEAVAGQITVADQNDPDQTVVCGRGSNQRENGKDGRGGKEIAQKIRPSTRNVSPGRPIL